MSQIFDLYNFHMFHPFPNIILTRIQLLKKIFSIFKVFTSDFLSFAAESRFRNFGQNRIVLAGSAGHRSHQHLQVLLVSAQLASAVSRLRTIKFHLELISWKFVSYCGILISVSQSKPYLGAGFYKAKIPQYPPSRFEYYSTCNRARLEFPTHCFHAVI